MPLTEFISIHTLESSSPAIRSLFTDKIAALVPRGRAVVGGEFDPRRSKDCSSEWGRQRYAEVVFELGMRMQDVRQDSES